MTPEEAARALRQFPVVLEAELRLALHDIGADLLETAHRYSSGPLSSSDLRRMGHPYARRNPRPPLPPGIINVQSGRFRRGWQLEGPQPGPHGDEVAVTNDTLEATFLARGTRLMIPRPVEDAILAEVEPRAGARFDAAIEAALRAVERG